MTPSTSLLCVPLSWAQYSFRDFDAALTQTQSRMTNDGGEPCVCDEQPSHVGFAVWHNVSHSKGLFTL